MTQQSLLELAKQGDAQAISTLMNRHLQPKGIWAKAILTEGCLQIILEAKSAPSQQEITAYVWNAMSRLGAPSIQKVKIYGKQTDSDFPAWHQEFDLKSPQSTNDLPVASNAKGVSLTTQIKPSNPTQDVILLECRGDATLLVVKTQGVLIKRSGGLLSTHSKGEKFIAYKSISNIQFHDSSALSYGFIYFQLAGSPTSSIKYLEAASNPDAIVFYNDKLSEFNKARLLILENVDLPSQNVAVQQQEQQDSSNANSEIQVRCPKCGSTQINANKKGFNIGQALVGGVVTLGVGAVAGFWGSNEIRLNCLKCGYRWKPKM